MAIPIAKTQFSSKSDSAFQYIPVVYIKNEVVNVVNFDAGILAKNMLSLINEMNENFQISPNQIQIDCDWTLQSKRNYFTLIDSLKKNYSGKISATIRLHQIKYVKKTGYPNVDYGVLMYYNMGNISSDSINSIYDRNNAKKYISSLQTYPLKLNIALPIYAWAIQIRDGIIVNVISNLRKENLQNSNAFGLENKDQYTCKTPGFYFGRYFKMGDRIKLESVEMEDVNEMMEDLHHHLKSNPEEILLFDLNKENIENIDLGNIRKSIDKYF